MLQFAPCFNPDAFPDFLAVINAAKKETESRTEATCCATNQFTPPPSSTSLFRFQPRYRETFAHVRVSSRNSPQASSVARAALQHHVRHQLHFRFAHAARGGGGVPKRMPLVSSRLVVRNNVFIQVMPALSKAFSAISR